MPNPTLIPGVLEFIIAESQAERKHLFERQRNLLLTNNGGKLLIGWQLCL